MNLTDIQEAVMEGYYEFEEIQCQACIDNGDMELSRIDLSDADGVNEAGAIWNAHLVEYHDKDPSKTDLLPDDVGDSA